MAEVLAQALAMPLAERRTRYRDMIAQLRENNVSVWRDNFLRDLTQYGGAESPAESLAQAAAKAAPKKRAVRTKTGGAKPVVG
jgi:trehalose 6-phosphate synthase